MPKVSRIKKPIFCPNATALGFTKYAAGEGDVIRFKTRHQDGSDHDTYGRVLGRANEDGTGKPYPKRPGHLLVLVMSETMTHAYTRHVEVLDVVEVRGPETFKTFVRWFFSSKLPSVEAVEAAVRYGATSASYVDKFLDGEGNLPEDWRKADSAS